MKILLFIALLAGTALGLFGSFAQAPPGGTDAEVTGYSFVPEKLNWSEELMDGLELPEGFGINVYAMNLSNPRMIAVGDDGWVYITEPADGNVTALRDADGDGRAEERQVVVSGIDGVHGIAIQEGALYIATPTTIYVASITAPGNVSEPGVLIDDLPDGGQHPNRTLGFGPDGRLYVSVGSSCNACPEPDPEHATMLVFNDTENATDRMIYARGLRNTLGFDWHPVTGDLWGMDQGSDWRGQDAPPEELNRINDGGNYGWPWCYGEMLVDPIISTDPENMSREEYCAMTLPPALEYQAHSSPIGFAFYNASGFPEEYRNDAFVTFRGSWNRKPPVGYRVTRVVFNDSGEPEGFEDFVTGFLVGDEESSAYFARIAGLAVASDGSLLVADDTNGVVYRISYQGNNTNGAV